MMRTIRKKNKNIRIVEKGFTLIEVLLVIFIMAVAIGTTLASFQNTKPMDEVEAATRQLSAVIREAQNNSLAGKQQLESGVLINICNNGIEWDGNATDSMALTLFSYKSAAPGPCVLANGRIDNRSETFKKVKLNPLPVIDASISFSVPGGAVTTSGFTLIGGDANSAQLRVESTTNSSIYALVCVYPNGRIEEMFGSANCL